MTIPPGSVANGRRASEGGGPGCVLLVGMMGAGKSSVGRLLARRLGFAFLDSDAEIEARAGRTIPEIFAEQGETRFRELETEILRSLPTERAVVALGGGAFVSKTNRDILEEKGRSVWLDARIDTLDARTRADPGRPLLAGLDAKGRAARLRELETQRRPAYACAHFRIETDDRTPDEIADAILACLHATGAPA